MCVYVCVYRLLGRLGKIFIPILYLILNSLVKCYFIYSPTFIKLPFTLINRFVFPFLPYLFYFCSLIYFLFSSLCLLFLSNLTNFLPLCYSFFHTPISFPSILSSSTTSPLLHLSPSISPIPLPPFLLSPFPTFLLFPFTSVLLFPLPSVLLFPFPLSPPLHSRPSPLSIHPCGDLV